MFANRVDAGRRLAGRLTHLLGSAPVVVGLPRGGVPVAYEVARALHAPLDVLASIFHVGVGCRSVLLWPGWAVCGRAGVPALGSPVPRVGLSGRGGLVRWAVGRSSRCR